MHCNYALCQMAFIFSRKLTNIFLSWVIMCNILSMEGLCGETADKIDNCQIFPMKFDENFVSAFTFVCM